MRRVSIIGAGAAGISVVARTAEKTSDLRRDGGSVRIVLADTDRIESRFNDYADEIIPCPLPAGASGSCGGDCGLGERAAGDVLERFDAVLKSSDLIFVVSGLAGGAGAGIAQVLARRVREQGRTAVFYMFAPFTSEGNWRRKCAEKAEAGLRELGASVLAVSNDHLFCSVSPSTSVPAAFEAATEAAAGALAGLVSAAVARPLVSVDLATLRGVIGSEPCVCGAGYGVGTGDDRWRTALERFFASPLLGGRQFVGEADSALVTVLGPADFSMAEFQACMRSIHDAFDTAAHVVVGAYHNPAGEGTDHFEIAGVVCRRRDRTRASRNTAAASFGGAASRSVDRGGRFGAQRNGADRPATLLQEELPLQRQTLGIFAGTEPTAVNGENLDVPTFQRRGVVIDQGDAS